MIFNPLSFFFHPWETILERFIERVDNYKTKNIKLNIYIHYPLQNNVLSQYQINVSHSLNTGFYSL